MSIQIWQIASGLGVGAFIAFLFYLVVKQFGRRSGQGFQTARIGTEATAIIAVLIILIFGGITVVALVLYAPKPGESKSGPSSSAIPNYEQGTPTIHPMPTGEVVVEYRDVDTRSAPGYTVAAAPYLHRDGISVTELKPQQSQVVLMNNLGLYGGAAITPTTTQNFLTQISTDNNGIASFTLVFAEPVDSVSFTRPALYPATSSGVTHPAWSAHALDADGREVSSQSEGITRSFVDVPAQQYTLRSPGFDRIVAVRFDSDWRLDGKPFAGFRAILIERLTLIRKPAAKSQ